MRRPAATVAALATLLLTVAALVAVACGAPAAPDQDPVVNPRSDAAGVGVVANPLPTTVPPTTAPATTTTTADPGTLPQTNDKPNPAAPELAARDQALWQAIVSDDPSVAVAAFFPLTAYQQVKDLKDPTSDWHNRLLAAFDADIHAYHRQLGANAATAQLLSVDIPMTQAQWINPHVEYNKIGYWRVYGTTIKYSVSGKTQTFKIASLISWRGQWYVVHLASIPT